MPDPVIEAPAAPAAPAAPPPAAAAPAAPAAAPAAPKTPPAAAAPAAPTAPAADWRKDIAGDDPKTLERLGRFASQKAMWDSFRELEGQLHGGKFRPVLPENPTPEQMSTYRKDMGIPDKPEAYELKLKDGLVIGEADKPVIESFKKAGHAKNYTPDQLSAAVEWYYAEQERQTGERERLDREAVTKAGQTLKAEWQAGDFQANLNMIDALLLKLPESVRDSVKHGRLADGTPLWGSADFLRGFAAIARETNPAAAVVPSGTGNVAGAIDDEIKQIEGWMNAQPGSPENAKYWQSDSTQKRLRDLYTARQGSQGAPRAG